MKIRTDFVTNSSSSNLCLEVAVEDKKGNRYYLTDNPYDYSEDGGTAYFRENLEKALYGYSDKKLREALANDFSLEKNQEYKCVQLAENLHVGAKVDISLGEVGEDQWGRFMAEIKVNSKDGYIGELYCYDGLEDIVNAIKRKRYNFYGVVTQVIPLSKRNSNSRKPLIYVHVFADEIGKADNEKNKILAFESVRELCEFLTNAVDDDNTTWGDDGDEYYGNHHSRRLQEKKEQFTKKVVKGIKTIDDVKSIIVTRDYYAWGEFADMIADNDSKLCRLAENVVNSSGQAKEEAKAEMLKYIHTSNDRQGESFGCGFSDFRYNWDDHNDLEKLAERLCSHNGPGDVSGTEYTEVDATTGKLTRYAEFNLK